MSTVTFEDFPTCTDGLVKKICVCRSMANPLINFVGLDSISNRLIRIATAAGRAEGKHSRTKNPKTKNHASDDDCTNERPSKYFEPSAAFNQVAKKVASKAAEHSTNYSGDL
jgi:hypothetical protein